MKQKLLILMLLFFSNSALCEEENFLVGSWISSKSETIRYNKHRANWTKDQYKIFEKFLGKLQLKITPMSIEWKYEGDTGKNKYEIEKLSKNSITIRPIIKEEEIEYFGISNFSGDVTFYRQENLIYTEPKHSKLLLREYFERVEE